MEVYNEGVIHERGLSLSEDERAWMRDMAKSETDRVLALFRGHPNHKFPAHQVARLTGIKKDHVKRSITDLAQTNPDKENYMDQWGQPALIKLGKEHKVERLTDSGKVIRVSCWTYNEDYGVKPQRLQQYPPTEKNGQANMFPDPAPKSRAYQEGM